MSCAAVESANYLVVFVLLIVFYWKILQRIKRMRSQGSQRKRVGRRKLFLCGASLPFSFTFSSLHCQYYTWKRVKKQGSPENGYRVMQYCFACWVRFMCSFTIAWIIDNVDHRLLCIPIRIEQLTCWLVFCANWSLGNPCTTHWAWLNTHCVVPRTRAWERRLGNA